MSIIPSLETNQGGSYSPLEIPQGPGGVSADVGALAIDSSAERQESTPAELIESRGYVRLAPAFSELVGDESRVNEFCYNIGSDTFKYETEHGGLVDLSDFLSRKRHESPHAQAMLENLTFIGEKEYAEGVKGLADYWKSYLDSDPEVQLCITTEVSTVYNQGVKSDVYTRERILEHFSDSELETYKGRLLVDIGGLTAPPEKTRIVLLDDWVISGSQMSRAYDRVAEVLEPDYRKRVELNLLVSSNKRVAGGFQAQRDNWAILPVKSYFLARAAQGPVRFEDNGAYVSGTHSAVDFDFKHLIYDMAKPVGIEEVPKLARVRRHYVSHPCPQTQKLRGNI